MSTLGYDDDANLEILLATSDPEEIFVYAATHELFHALGRIHEHNRPDRDRYIRMKWANMIPGIGVLVTPPK